MQQSDPVKLEEQLKNRKLSGNIQEYYKFIWDAAKKNMQIPFVDYKMAGVFAFLMNLLMQQKCRRFFRKKTFLCQDGKMC